MILLQGDCLELMKKIPNGSIDAIICDPPYGILSKSKNWDNVCKWDNPIDFALMWEQLNRIIKKNGAIVLFGSEPFSSALRMSNIKNYKYDWIWEKPQVTGFMQGKIKPLNDHENIVIFGDFSLKAQNFNGTYNKVGAIEVGGKAYSNKRGLGGIMKSKRTGVCKSSFTNLPRKIITFSKDKNKLHPTQKPVVLLEYLIKTYTNENETVLDFTMGSGSTGIACLNTNRQFIGMELDQTYFEMAKKRIDEHQVQRKLFK